MQKLTFIIACVFLAPCALGEIKAQKKNSANSIEFNVEENYQRVYKNLLEKMHECKGEAWVGESTRYRIKNELYDEHKKGQITFFVFNAGKQIYYIHIKIDAIGDNKTKAKAYVYYSTQEDYLPLISQWTLGGNSGCEISEQNNT